MSTDDVVKGRYSTYHLQDLIGKGGNAVVYSAIDRANGATVAVKKMMARDDTLMAMWRKEVAIMSSMEHPYIIRYIDHTRSDKAFIIVSEYAPGGSILRQLKRRGRFEEREVSRFMFKITVGLAYIHEKKFLHRDLKCANVLLGAGDVVKLSDFGLAVPHGLVRDGDGDGDDDDGDDDEGGAAKRVAGAMALEEGIVGSVYWMAPETIRGEQQNESSDIWSLGCLCVELLTGNPPFFDRTPANALYHIAQSDEIPIPPIDLSDECRDFLTQCLSRDPKKRSTAEALLQHRWFSWFVTENVLETLASTQAPDIGPEQAANRSTSIGRWVEDNLFPEKAEQREQWLRSGCLRKVVAVLPKLTAEASFQIIRAFSYAAQRCRTEESCFLTQLGEANLWDNADLGVLGKAESLSTIFVCCCEMQDPRVVHYTPTHPGALRFLLQCPEGDIATTCIDALHGLLVGATGDDDEVMSTLSAPTESASDKSKRTYRRFLAQKRLRTDRAVPAVQCIVEDACCAAFDAEEDPIIGWPRVDKLFEVLVHVFKKTGDECVVVGSSLSPSPVTESPRGASASLSAHSAEAPGGAGGSAGAAPGGLAGLAGAAAAPPPPGDAAGDGTAGGAGGRAVAGDRWLLALQEASRHLCPNAILLFLQYVHHASRNQLDSLRVCGKSIAGAFLVIATNATVEVSTRIALLKCLPLLQCASPVAATFLRDPRCCVPLFEHAAKNIRVPDEAREDDVLRVLLSLCEDERMAAVYAASEAFLNIAVDRATVAAQRGRWSEVILALRFVEIIFIHSLDPSRVVDSRRLLKLLMCLSESEGIPERVVSAAQRLLNSLQAQTNVM